MARRREPAADLDMPRRRCIRRNPCTVKPAVWLSSRRNVTGRSFANGLSGMCHDVRRSFTSSSKLQFALLDQLEHGQRRHRFADRRGLEPRARRAPGRRWAPLAVRSHRPRRFDSPRRSPSWRRAPDVARCAADTAWLTCARRASSVDFGLAGVSASAAAGNVRQGHQQSREPVTWHIRHFPSPRKRRLVLKSLGGVRLEASSTQSGGHTMAAGDSSRPQSARLEFAR